MLTIRLQRIGKKSQPSYRLIISENSKATNSSVLEYLGSYQPASKDKKISLETERIQYWISKGAGCSKTVNNILVKNNVIEGKKLKTFSIPTKVKKAREAAASKAAEEAKKAEAAAKKAAEEAAAKAEAEKAAADTANTEASTTPETKTE